MRAASKPARVFMWILGSVMGITAIAFPVTTLLHGLGVLERPPPWGFWSAIAGAFFFSLAAVEMFSGRIVEYAGELVRGLASRVVEKARNE